LPWPCPVSAAMSHCHGHVSLPWPHPTVMAVSPSSGYYTACLSELGQAVECQAMFLPYAVLGAELGKAQWCLATDLMQSHSSGAVALQHPDHIPEPTAPTNKMPLEEEGGLCGLFCTVSCPFRFSMHFASAKNAACHALAIPSAFCHLVRGTVGPWGRARCQLRGYALTCFPL